MKRSTMHFVLGSLLSVGGAVMIAAAYKERDRECAVRVIKDNDMRNSVRVDHQESVDADKDPAEQGLSQLDSAYRSEWVANGFPQTHRELELQEQT